MITRREALEELARRKLAERAKCLWPDEYSTPESGIDFVLNELRTWNESEGEIQGFPEKQYLRDIGTEWIICRQARQPLIIEKCRRMVVSWLLRGLELHLMGLGRADLLLAGNDFESAAKHVWRLEFMYKDLAGRRPAWNLPPNERIKEGGEKRLVQFSLPNGSVCERTNDDPDQVRGEGKTVITAEELSIFKHPGTWWAQALIMTQGKGGKRMGFVVGVCNASANPQWKELKALRE